MIDALAYYGRDSIELIPKKVLRKRNRSTAVSRVEVKSGKNILSERLWHVGAGSGGGGMSMCGDDPARLVHNSPQYVGKLRYKASLSLVSLGKGEIERHSSAPVMKFLKMRADTGLTLLSEKREREHGDLLV